MDRHFALVLACFFLSGLSALLYQTAWSRELSFVFGTADLAVAAVLAAYMGGLALGAAAAARLAARVRRPVLAYGVLELAIALCALAVPWGIRGFDALYVALFGGPEVLSQGVSPWVTLYQLASGFALLLPPTAFMGATLPLLARHAVRREDEIAPRVGLLYGVNTAGAIAGALVAAFWLMPELGLRRTVWVGASVNAAVFALAALLARSAPLAPEASDPGRPATVAAGGSWILPAIALSGAVSFAYEVLWTRLLGHLLGASVQAFATMLAGFLLGIALGSAVAARLAGDRARAAAGFAIAQLGIAVTSYAAFALADRLPELAQRFGAGPDAPFASALLAVMVLLPVTLCIGATFPFAVRILARRPEEAAPATARVYAWNTLGAIAGALGGGLLLLPELGFEGTMIVGVAASLALAATAAVLPPRRLAVLGAAAAAAVTLALVPPQPPWRLITARTFTGDVRAGNDRVFAAVGRSSTVVVVEGGGRFHLATNGLPEASVDTSDLPVTDGVAHWLGALPAWVRPDVREVIVIGLGAGVSLELVPRSYDSIDVIELEPEVLAANRRMAADRVRDPLSDPRVRVHLGDARGTLRLTGRRFDAIVSQPSHPWTAGASHLYTREFFSLVRSRLEPDGVFVQWIGGSFVDEGLMRSLLAALLAAFPNVEVFLPRAGGFLFAASETPIDPLEGAARFLEEAPEDLARLGVQSYEDLVSLWVLGTEGAMALAEGVAPNSDDDNQLAARSARLGNTWLGPKKIQKLLGPHDPLRDAPGLDRAEIVRALLELGHDWRARDLAEAAEGVTREIARGWIELEDRRHGRAARHFQKVLEEDPGRRDARSGLILARKVALSQKKEVPGVSDAELDRDQALVIAGWRHAREKEWQALGELDAELSRIAPSDPLYEEASLLRVEQRLQAGGPQAAPGALDLATDLLKRSLKPGNLLLHARAALNAQEFEVALRSLAVVANMASAPGTARTRSGRLMAERVLELGRELPKDQYASLRERLRWLGLGKI